MRQQPSPLVKDALHEIVPLSMATDALRTHLAQRLDVAWAWHNMIVTPLLDITSLFQAHCYAAKIMQNLYGVNTQLHPDFPSQNTANLSNGRKYIIYSNLNSGNIVGNSVP